MDLDSRTALFFYGKLPGDGTGTKNKFLTLSILVLQFSIWEEKLRRKKSSFSTIDLQFGEHVRTLTNMNKKIFISAEKLNLPLCRTAGILNYNTPQPAWTTATTIPRRRP
jgi:hypothetical protein